MQTTRCIVLVSRCSDQTGRCRESLTNLLVFLPDCSARATRCIVLVRQCSVLLRNTGVLFRHCIVLLSHMSCPKPDTTRSERCAIQRVTESLQPLFCSIRQGVGAVQQRRRTRQRLTGWLQPVDGTRQRGTGTKRPLAEMVQPLTGTVTLPTLGRLALGWQRFAMTVLTKKSARCRSRWCGAQVLYRPTGRLSQRCCRIQRPLMIAQHFAAEQHQIGLPCADNLIGLLR